MSAALQYLAQIDLSDRERWPDSKIGEFILVCKFITAAEVRGQPMHPEVLAMVNSWVPQTKQVVSFDPAAMRDTMEQAMEMASRGQLRTAGAAIRAALLDAAARAADKRDAARHRIRQGNLC